MAYEHSAPANELSAITELSALGFVLVNEAVGKPYARGVLTTRLCRHLLASDFGNSRLSSFADCPE